MNFGKLFSVNIIISLIELLVVAYINENGDSNAMSMYLVVFFFPIVIISFLYGLYIEIVKKMNSINLKIRISFIPIIVLLILAVVDNITINIIDGDLNFLFLIETFSVGITNLIWCYYYLKKIKDKTIYL
ncbi:hypothetical protein QVZ41_13945 [Wenyingzhuangia sp. chi5]|uniref:Uncharacterized protein n=1 Tax=Wenyingzhuangia gilva TaxID=3057677 RepID=A0ABT8VVF1_9FLAO|nr:hypothetical protein [Wenyingzhuangia sp. chi5]MDO3695949.1 hypothetical protein [Wenyingzhuangia sp. chi5]